jgi:hypothetical protein
MKTTTLILCINIFITSIGWSQAHMEVGVFRDNEANAYVELFLKLDRELLGYKEMIGMKYQASVNAVASLLQNDKLLSAIVLRSTVRFSIIQEICFSIANTTHRIWVFSPFVLSVKQNRGL